MARPNFRQKCNVFDVHETLTREIYSQGVDKPNPNLQRALQSASAPASTQLYDSIKDATFYFDSLYQDLSAVTGVGQLAFSIVNLNGLNPIQNVIALKIGSFYFPNLGTVGLTDFFYYRRVYLKIENIVKQSSVQAANTESYHFEFDVQNINSTAVLLTPINELFYFQAPITALSSIIFTFYTPLNFKHIPIPSAQIVVQPDPANLATGDFLVITGGLATDIGPIGVLLPPGIAVFFTNYTSGNPVIDAQVNAAGGIYVTDVLTSTSFRLSIPIAIAPPTVMIVGKNRIAFQMRFTSLAPSADNGLIPVHV
jgi:hypothetical protein